MAFQPPVGAMPGDIAVRVERAVTRLEGLVDDLSEVKQTLKDQETRLKAVERVQWMQMGGWTLLCILVGWRLLIFK